MSLATLRQADVAAQERPGPVAPAAQSAARRKPHVCFVAPYAWPVLSRDPNIQVVGGAEVQQCILARLLAANGYRVSMICFDYGQPSPVLIDGVTVYKSFRPDAGVPVLRFVYPRLTTMWRVLRDVDADVYYQRSSAMWTGVIAEFCRRHGKRSVYAGASDRDFEVGQEQIVHARDRWLYRHGLAGVDRIVAQNPYQIESCRRNHGRPAVLIPSCYEPPVDSRRASTANERILWVGTIHGYKRPEMFLDLAERLPGRRFVMVGGPSVGGERLKAGYYESIRERAAGLPNVEFTGFLPLAQVEPWFDRARVLVSTSVYEGMPNVFLQAWARGVPTVATVDVGAPVNTVFADAAEGAQKIDALFTDPALWTRASDDSLAYFQRNHSSAEVLGRYSRLLEELTAAKK
ncbi:MAG TPA: glycosyltransferase family 4 protein [Burkholderiales bacterium]|nr:glycosyltransferase family 4 protein [Burkholderiales bacterium]